MTNTIDITNLIEVIIAIIVMVASYFVIPFIKSKLTAVQWNNLQAWAEVTVKAAEVIFKGTKLGNEKRKYVMSQLTYLCEKNGYSFDKDLIRVALENAWKNMTDGELKPIEYRAEISG